MGFMTIDGKQVEFTDEPNVLSVIRKADIDIPTLCYPRNFPYTARAAFCTVEMKRAKRLPPAPKSQKTAWWSTPTRRD